MERLISAAAKRLGEDIQHVVFAAKQANQAKTENDQWKDYLLEILGGSDEDVRKEQMEQKKKGPDDSFSSIGQNNKTDIETLLLHSNCDKFVLRCLENELPPNLIHCMRLLRVLELQMAHSLAATHGEDENDQNNLVEMKPSTTEATKKVEELLCKLCSDISVGEQLRPHLFGLLAMSGASYPPNAVHIAHSTSNVIVAIAQGCLSHNLAYFFHERKMIVHMTDDYKELCGMTTVSSSTSAPFCLQGQAADTYGLWFYALRAIVYLIRESCKKDFFTLLKDFYSAGGYHVLCHAISHSGTKYMKNILELAMLMISCQTEEAAELGLEDLSIASGSSTDSASDDLFASNPTAYDVIETLMFESVPLLIDFRNKNNGEKLIIDVGDSLNELAKMSIQLSMKILAAKSTHDTDQKDAKDVLSYEILLSTMHLYSDHRLNYTIIEEKYEVLTLYLLSYTTFTCTDIKKLVLMTLEYACTGISEADCTKPLYTLAEIFFSLCKTLFRLCVDEDRIEENRSIIEVLKTDAITICSTLEKLLEVEDSLGEILIDCGILSGLLDEYLVLIMTIPSELNRSDLSFSDDKDIILTQRSDIVDDIYSAICRLLDLIIKSSVAVSAVTSPRSDESISPHKKIVIEKRRDDLNMFLIIGITELGVKASTSALTVFESKLSYGDDTALQYDMECIVKMFNQLSKQYDVNKQNDVSWGKTRKLPMTIHRSNRWENVMVAKNVLQMLKKVLDENKSAQEIFRLKGGFESLVGLLGFLKECPSSMANIHVAGNHNKEILSIVQIIFEVLDAATTPTEKESKSSRYFNSVKNIDLFHDANTMFKSPVESNRLYMRENAIYERVVSSLFGLPLFNTLINAREVLMLCFLICEPTIYLLMKNHPESSRHIIASSNIRFLRNADAIRLILGTIILLPLEEPFLNLAKDCLSVILDLCAPYRAGTTLNQIAETGICVSLSTHPDFVAIFDNIEHPLHNKFVELLMRISSFKLSYMDFVSMLRGIAGPIVKDQSKTNNIILPIVASHAAPKTIDVQSTDKEKTQIEEKNYCLRLQTLVAIAERGDRVPRCSLGGHSIPLAETREILNDNDSIYRSDKEGQMRFIEIRKVDATSNLMASGNTNSVSTNTNAVDKVWTPVATSGLSFSIWLRLLKSNDNSSGNIFIFDISSPSQTKNDDIDFVSVWYDNISKAFKVITSNWLKPISFPASPLSSGVWHHILLTFQPPKMANVLSRKTIIGLCVDGRPLEVDLKIDSVPLSPQSMLKVGIPNPYLCENGIVDGYLPEWDAGSLLLISTILGPRDAMSIFAAGPDFRGQFWGDRPQRMSLSATATTVVSMLAECGENCSVTAALKRRNLVEIESAGHVMRNSFIVDAHENDSSRLLSAVGLFCQLAPENITCALHPSSRSLKSIHSHISQENILPLTNVAKVNGNNSISTDALVYGAGSIIHPNCFSDNVQWIGGPSVLLPILNSARTPSVLALALRLIRESTHRHAPNLEMLQSGGGYPILALLLHQKRIMNTIILDHCFAFTTDGFIPRLSESDQNNSPSNRWVFVDPDAMKYLILNHQVWNINSSGPQFSSHLLSLLNGLVDSSTIHNVFNARRLHLLGIVQWIVHFMLEIGELYTTGTIGEMWSNSENVDSKQSNEVLGLALSAYKNGWFNKYTLSITSTCVGGDPGIPLLLSCKVLLRNVLARMQTPEDLRYIANAVVYTLSIDTMHDDITSELGLESSHLEQINRDELQIGAATRIYLLRLLEELVVDGIDDITSSSGGMKGFSNHNDQNNLAQLSSLSSHEKKSFMTRIRNQTAADGLNKQKEQNLQYFLSIFSSVLTPSWFACILQGCRDEASASVTFHFLIVMLQSSQTFAKDFLDAGGFTPLVLSIPKYSTSSTIILSMLSQLLHAPILHLPSFRDLDGEQLCSIFDSESDANELILHGRCVVEGLKKLRDPSTGIFALLVECMGRNIQLGAVDNKLGFRARQINEAVLILLTHRHKFSSSFQDFCASPDFLEPMAQSLCLVHSEKMLEMGSTEESSGQLKSPSDESNINLDNDITETSEHLSNMSQSSGERDGVLVDWPSSNEIAKKRLRRGRLESINMDDSPTARFVGKGGDSSGTGLVRLLHHVISHSVTCGPRAAQLIDALFKSFPLHSSTQDVEAFHLVLIDQCRLIIEDTLQRESSDSLISISNCVGISSVLFDRLCEGFFSSESILNATNIILSTLRHISNNETCAYRILSKEDPESIIRSDAANLARLTTLVALQRSKPNSLDHGDEILQMKILSSIYSHLAEMLCVDSIPKAPPESGNRRYIWESNSIVRCSGVESKFEGLYELVDPINDFIVALMAELWSFLILSNRNLREQASSVVIVLVKSRLDIVPSILKQTITTLGSPVRKVDLFHEGGFGALQYHGIVGDEIDSRRLQRFFDWIDANESDVNVVFDKISEQASELLPCLYIDQILCPEDAIDIEQKAMLLNLTSKEASNKTILATFNRTQLAQSSHDDASEGQVLWKRQGLDDLSSGAMKWKAVLRQLKGSCSLWEGSSPNNSNSWHSESDLDQALQQPLSPRTPETRQDLMSRWKLDISEGYERQRRKLIPNHEFYTLYNVLGLSNNEDDDSSKSFDFNEDSFTSGKREILNQSGFDLNPENVEATAELLAKMKLAKTDIEYYDDDDDDYDEFEVDNDDDNDCVCNEEELPLSTNDVGNETSSDENTSNTNTDKILVDGDIGSENNDHEEVDNDVDEQNQESQGYNYNLITGLLNTGDIPEKSYNVKRCSGLEVCSALFIKCRFAIYVIDGFVQTDEDGLRGNITRIEKTTSTFNVNLRSSEFSSGGEEMDDDTKKVKTLQSVPRASNTDESFSMFTSLYQHRCKRIDLKDIYVFYRRRYQLKQLALEIFDVHNNGTLIAFESRSQSEEVLQSLLNATLPNSILNSVPGNSTNYDKFMKALRARITNAWVQGKMSNFEFIMHLNSFAGRSYNDLTQYPVFPWVLADYESEEIDLANPKVYRDLSKPMGAIGSTRAEKFRERFESLESHFLKEDDPPPFHYGTHYSCAAYVVNYLMRIEPFSRLALLLQGGKFDLPDRMFSDIAASWRSASHDNLQDVRELIPEFFYLPDFLENKNSFDFGVKQDGSTVHHVKLPPWAKGDPRRFVRINRKVSIVNLSLLIYFFFTTDISSLITSRIRHLKVLT